MDLTSMLIVPSGVPQWSVLGPLLFLAYVNDIWRNTESNIRLFADDCIIYRKIMDSSDIDTLEMDLNRSGEWMVENEMKINPGKIKQKASQKERTNNVLFWGSINPGGKQL